MQQLEKGVCEAFKKDGSKYYRASLTYKGKHISLGSYENEAQAAQAYEHASCILREDVQESKFFKIGKKHDGTDILAYSEKKTVLSFAKWVMLINLRDNGIYCNGPIYLHKKYFDYYVDQSTVLRFSADDLFYYTHHNIQRRGGHFFVADYGLQVCILSRYGVKSFAVKNKDYYFKNGDEYDFRSGNIIIQNQYIGVVPGLYRGKYSYATKIHVGKSDYIVGHYDSERDAAIAYNKAARLLKILGSPTAYRENYIEGVSEVEYRLIYQNLKISQKLKELSFK